MASSDPSNSSKSEYIFSIELYDEENKPSVEGNFTLNAVFDCGAMELNTQVTGNDWANWAVSSEIAKVGVTGFSITDRRFA